MPATKRRTTRSRAADMPTSALYQTIADRINKRLGDNTVVDVNGEDFVLSTVTEYISTQCYGLNYAMHLPGIPVGRITCIRGNFMSGKSTLAQHLLAETQAMGGFAVLLDTEYAFAKDRAEAIGLDLSPDKWMLVQVETVESAVSALRDLIETARELQDQGEERLITIVWDSIGATATEAEMKAEFGESRPGLHARLLSQALRQLTPQIAKYRIALVLVNQEKAKVDFFSAGRGEESTTMTAEKPIMFHSTVVLRPQHMGILYNSKKEPTGIRVRTIVRKNKLAAPFSRCEFIINFSNGIDNAASILSIATQFGIVKKKAAWYDYKGEKFQEKGFSAVMAAHPEIMETLEAYRTMDAAAKAKAQETDEGDLADDDDDDEEETEDE